MLSSEDVTDPCPDCEYSDVNRQVRFWDDDVYPPQRVRRCAPCTTYPDAQEMDSDGPFEDCCGPLTIFYGMCMDCIDDFAQHLLKECALCQFFWKTLRALPPLERVCKPCLPLYSLQREVWLLYGPVRLRTEVEPGPDCQICIEKQKHQFLLELLQTGHVRLCWPCLKALQPDL